MKKLALAALMVISLAGAGFAQTAPAKKTKPAQGTEIRKDDKMSSDTTGGHRHAHKGTKHTKAKA